METQSKTPQPTYGAYSLRALGTKGIVAAFEETTSPKTFFQDNSPFNPDDLLARSASRIGKKSFLVFRNNKYIIVPTDAVAFFYVKNEYSIIVCFDRQEYLVNYSLEHIQNVLPEL